MADAFSFKAGDVVPDWLLVAEPKGRDSRPGVLRFAIDCDVFDGPNYFLVLPKVVSALCAFDDREVYNCLFCAAGKPVWVSQGCDVLLPPEQRPATCSPEQVLAWPTASAPPVQVPAKRGFWARLFRR